MEGDSSISKITDKGKNVLELPTQCNRKVNIWVYVRIHNYKCTYTSINLNLIEQ